MVRNRLAITLVAALVFIFCASAAQSQPITTFAGGGNPTGQANTIPVGFPWTMIQDTSGNKYIVDNHSNRIFKVDTGGNLTVIAGNTGDGLEISSTPLLALGTSLSFPQDIALDSTNGALYLADDGNNEVRVINTNATGSITLFPSAATPLVVPAGDIADVAGLVGGLGCLVSVTPNCGDNQFATNAALTYPAGVAVDGSGNIIIADTADNVIREVAHDTGIITKISGTYCNGACTGGGDGGPASAASFNNPSAVALDSLGNIYVADASDHAIRVIDTMSSPLILFGGALTIAPGDIKTVAGTFGSACSSGGSSPFCGDTGTSTSARLNLPTGVLVDADHNIYIADAGSQVVRTVSGSTGTITLLAGTYFDNCSPASTEAHCGDGGPATAALLYSPTGIMLDGSGNVFIADELNDAVREVVPGGNITTFAGLLSNRGYYGDGGAATNAELENPVGVGTDNSGDVFIADPPSNVVRKVDAAGTISTVAGSLTSCLQAVGGPPCGDGGLATAANLWAPSDVFVDSAGNLYIADTLDNAIRKIDVQTGTISTVAGDNAMFMAGFAGDGGPATSALLHGPSGVYVDSSGNIFISDTVNNRIRKVTASTGVITTVAGNGTAGYAGDGGAATSAELNNPSGVFVDAAGNIYIADGTDIITNKIVSNNVVRMVDTAGNISTVAGDVAKGGTYSGDGGPATQAGLWGPWGVVVDFLGNLFISDSQNGAIRVVNLSTTTNMVGGQTIAPGEIETVIGMGPETGFSGDNGPALQSLIHEPLGMRSDSAGNLYFADRLNWRVRKVAGIVATPSPNFTISAAALSPSSVSPGGSATSTITITSVNGFNAAVALSCSVSPYQPGAPACTVTTPVTPPANGMATSTLTITTTGASSLVRPPLVRPTFDRRSTPFYAVWLFLPAMLLSTAARRRPGRRHLLGYFLTFFALVGCLFLAACVQNNSGSGGNSGTPAGMYTVTVSGNAATFSTVTTTLNLTVQ
jgi:trimeric autotransporter adhesin